MADEDIRIAVLESQQKAHVDASLANQEEFKQCFKKLFTLVEETKNCQFEIRNDQTKHDGRIGTVETRVSHLENHMNSSNGVLDFMNRAKGSIAIVMWLYPVLYGLMLLAGKYLL